ncbi:glycine zipper family protein [Thermococcus sp.]
MFFTVKAWNFASDALNFQFHVVNESGKVVYPKDGEWVSRYIPKDAENYTLASFDRNVFGIGDHTYTVVARISGEEENDSVTIKVKPATALKAFMDCSDMTLSAKSGDLVLDMECDVHFTNPTDVKWNITRIDVEAHVLKTQYTKDLTIEPTKTIITHTVPPGGIGEFKLDFHDVLSQSGLIETGWKLKDLAGAKVPVQVNFTVYANDHPYIIISQGNILDLGYTTTQYVEIKVELNSVIQHIVADTVAGVVIGAGAGAIVGSILPGIGTMAGATAGAIIGGTLGFVYGVVWHGLLGRP